jgi:hypothetical protein
MIDLPSRCGAFRVSSSVRICNGNGADTDNRDKRRPRIGALLSRSILFVFVFFHGNPAKPPPRSCVTFCSAWNKHHNEREWWLASLAKPYVSRVRWWIWKFLHTTTTKLVAKTWGPTNRSVCRPSPSQLAYHSTLPFQWISPWLHI